MRAFWMIVVASAIALSGCSKPEGIQIVDPVIRLSANPKAPSAGYFTLKGGPTTDRLLSVTSPIVIRIEMHESMTSGGIASMKPLDGGVELPAKGTVKFEEGGRHLMLYNINPGVKPGETVQLNFTFASGLILQSYAPVRAPGS
jgi:copper(I)-binding protein